MRYQGKITNWKDEQGFGFVVPNGGGQQAFVHIKSFASGQKRPVGNEVITYEVAFDPMGRPQAENISYALKKGGKAARSSVVVSVMFPIAALFMLGLGASVFVGTVPPVLFAVYGAVSLGTFAFYAADKSAAASGSWRTKESTLHLLALCGGWPGAAAAQRMINHKSSKPAFQLVYRVTVVLNCIVMAWLLRSDQGRAMLQALSS